MTERIRTLLDEAVAGVGPRDPDPVPELLRRGRTRQRRLGMAGGAAAVAVVVLATGGLVAANRSQPDHAPAAAAPSRPTPEPVDATVSGDRVEIGGLAVRIPRGWQVIQDKKLDYCRIPARSVLVNVMQFPGGECDLHPQIAVGRWLPRPYKVGHAEQLGTINEVILPGGQPVWLDADELHHLQSLPKKPGDAFTGAQTSMPWAGVTVSVDGPRSQIDAVLRDISAERVAPARLTLPDRPAIVHLALGPGAHLTSTKPGVVKEVLHQLAKLDDPVQDGDLPCAGAEQVTATWRLAGSGMAGLTFSNGWGATDTTTIAISPGGTCAFATSSLGGRVHLPAGFLVRIQKLLGAA